MGPDDQQDVDDLESFLDNVGAYQQSEGDKIRYADPVILRDEYMLEEPVTSFERELWRRYVEQGDTVEISVRSPDSGRHKNDGYVVRLLDDETYIEEGVLETGDAQIAISQNTGYSGDRCKLEAKIQAATESAARQIHGYIDDIADTYAPVETDTEQEVGHVPDETWDDIVLPDDVEERVQDRILRPLENPGVYESVGLGIESGVMLEGAPGTGKTLLARVIAGEHDAEFYSVAISDITDKYYGNSEDNVRDVFDQARNTDGSAIIFLDEADSLLQDRDTMYTNEATRRVVNEFLQQMDGMEPLENVMVLGATNRYDALDPAVTRPGRFGERISLGEPDLAAREEILKVHARDGNFADDIDYAAIAEQATDLVGADLRDLVDEARWNAVRHADDVNDAVVTADDFMDALDTMDDDGRDDADSLDTGQAFQ